MTHRGGGLLRLILLIKRLPLRKLDAAAARQQHRRAVPPAAILDFGTRPRLLALLKPLQTVGQFRTEESSAHRQLAGRFPEEFR